MKETIIIFYIAAAIHLACIVAVADSFMEFMLCLLLDLTFIVGISALEAWKEER